MFAEKIGESCSTTGTGTFSLGGAYGSFRTWRTGFATGADAFYYATNDTGSIWELGYGALTYATPDTLTRTLVASSSGALINWATTPYRIYSVPSASTMKHLLAPLVNGVANVPLWLPAGGMWLDYALGAAVAWVKKVYISGTRTTAANHSEEGRHHLASGTNFFAASQRALFVDKGAANYTLTADDIGKCLCFDTTASVRVLTMLAASAAGMGHGAYVYVMPYGSASNGVTFTPGGADTTDLATAPAGRMTKFQWDGAKSTWRSDSGASTGTTAAQASNNTGVATNAYVDRVAAQQVVVTSSGAVATGTTVIPHDDTIPQNTEGDQYLSLAITPKSAASKLVIEVTLHAICPNANYITMALFQDSTANALDAVARLSNTVHDTFYILYEMVSGTTSATTFKVRAGPGAGDTLTVNGQSTARMYGGVMLSKMTITEYGI